MTRLSRRSLLAAMGVSPAFLPLLQESGARAADAPFPKRLIVVMTPNGVVPSAFWPKGGETNFTIDPNGILAPLLPYKSDINILGGIELSATIDDIEGAAGGHGATAHLLTGTKGGETIQDGSYHSPVGNSQSVDQYIALALAKQTATPFVSLEQAVMNWEFHLNCKYISFRGPATGAKPNQTPQGNQPEIDPYRLASRLFKSASMDDPKLAKIRAERKSMLDYVGHDLERFAKKVGTDDRAKIQSHLDAVRQMEMQLGGSGASCASPTLTAGIEPDLQKTKSVPESKDFPALMDMHFDLLTAALQCNLTQVATVMLSDPRNDHISFPWLGGSFVEKGRGEFSPYRNHHEISHHWNDSDSDRALKVGVEKWFFTKFAELIARFKAIPEGSGTMLDNSVILWANVMADGAAHSVRAMPWVMAGGCGGYFKTGRYMKYGDFGGSSYDSGSKFVSHNALLVSLANAMGVPTQTFGDPKYGSGELPGLRA